MTQKSYAHVFKASPSARPATKTEITDRAAREIIDREANASEAKIDRLRAARLAREAELAAQAPAAPVKKRKK